MKKYILLIILLFATSVTDAQKMNRTDLNSLFSTLENHEQFMGGISISHGQKEIYHHITGKANIEREVPVTEGTRYRIGSVSKMFTASIIMQLVEEGTLELETPLSEFFPGLPNAEIITIRQMLQHKSGLFNFTSDPGFLDWRTEPRSREDLLMRIDSLGTVFAPGERQEYSNTNYVLLSFIAEELDRTSFARILEKRITAPVGLTQTSFAKEEQFASMATSYHRKEGWIPAENSHYSIPLGAGAIVSTPRDLNRFITALFDGRVVKEESLRQMQDYQGRYGMGLSLMKIEDVELVGHSGGIDGFKTVLYRASGQNISFAITSNGAEVSLNNLLVLVARISLGMEYELPIYNSQYRHSTEELEVMSGVYTIEKENAALSFKAEEGELWIEGLFDQPSALIALERYRFGSGMKGFIFEFLPAENKLLVTQSGKTYEFVKR